MFKKQISRNDDDLNTVVDGEHKTKILFFYCLQNILNLIIINVVKYFFKPIDKNWRFYE